MGSETFQDLLTDYANSKRRTAELEKQRAETSDQLEASRTHQAAAKAAVDKYLVRRANEIAPLDDLENSETSTFFRGKLKDKPTWGEDERPARDKRWNR